MGDPKPFRILLPLAAVIALFAFAPAAGAATTCTIDSPAVLNVHMNADFDSARLTVEGGTLVVHNAQNAPVDCGVGGPPTVNNIDTVFIIDDSAGGSTEARITAPTTFAPGKTAEADGFSNIEFLINLNTGPQDLLQIFGTLGGDSWVFGNDGANFSADSGDPSPNSQLILTPMSQFDRVLLSTDEGSDTVSGQGGAGTGSAFTGPGQFELHAGGGDDTLDGGDTPTGEFLDGQGGDDTSRGFAGDDTINDETGNDTIDGGTGAHDAAQYHDTPPTGATVDLSQTGPQVTGNGTDTITNVEDVSGSDQGDRLTGDAGPNILTGGQGPDTLDGRGGNDLLDGGAEPDTASFANAPAGETVDLAAGSATGGDGTDTLTEMENIVGSPFADSLVGSALPNEITGLAGVDAVVAQGGADKVDVRDGGPDTASCGTEIDTATADQKSVDAVNVDCETVDYLPEPTPTPTNNPTTGGGTTTGTPVGGADGTGPGGPNDRELTFSLAGSRAQRVLRQKAVIVTATCPVETCAVVASATGKLPRVRQRAGAAALTTLALKPVVAQVTAGAPKRLKLRLDRAQLKALKAAVKARKRVKLTVTVLASDVAGNSVTRTQSVKVKR